MMREASTRIAAKEYAQAQQILTTAIKFRDQINDPVAIDWILRTLGSTWLFQGLFVEQIAFFTEYLRRHPSDMAAYHERATALWYLGKLQESIRDYSRALELKPSDVESLSGRGQVLAEIGDSQQALRDLDVALELLGAIPKSDERWREWSKHTEAFIRRGRGVAYGGWTQIRQAINEFDASIALSPENAWVYYSRAQVYDRIRDDNRALSDYRTALAKSEPPLTPVQKENARARLQSLSANEHS
ncbi:MAG: tetratricopeptide repeat protein [Candidatus Acidiferrales bacterium]